MQSIQYERTTRDINEIDDVGAIDVRTIVPSSYHATYPTGSNCIVVIGSFNP